MDTETITDYKNIKSKNLLIVEDNDITPSLQISDLMLSDTSSVVYEFILLNKPVITLNSHSDNISWEDHSNIDVLTQSLISILKGDDKFKESRQNIINKYHPYSDGKSAQRMIDATVTYIEQNGVPKKRKIPFLRKLKLKKKYSS